MTDESFDILKQKVTRILLAQDVRQPNDDLTASVSHAFPLPHDRKRLAWEAAEHDVEVRQRTGFDGHEISGVCFVVSEERSIGRNCGRIDFRKTDALETKSFQRESRRSNASTEVEEGRCQRRQTTSSRFTNQENALAQTHETW